MWNRGCLFSLFAYCWSFGQTAWSCWPCRSSSLSPLSPLSSLSSLSSLRHMVLTMLPLPSFITLINSPPSLGLCILLFISVHAVALCISVPLSGGIALYSCVRLYRHTRALPLSVLAPLYRRSVATSLSLSLSIPHCQQHSAVVWAPLFVGIFHRCA